MNTSDWIGICSVFLVLATLMVSLHTRRTDQIAKRMEVAKQEHNAIVTQIRDLEKTVHSTFIPRTEVEWRFSIIEEDIRDIRSWTLGGPRVRKMESRDE